MLDRNAIDTLAEVKSINKRILVLHLSGNPKTTIIHYNPIEGYNKVEDHYNCLSDVIKLIPKYNLL